MAECKEWVKMVKVGGHRTGNWLGVGRKISVMKRGSQVEIFKDGRKAAAKAAELIREKIKAEEYDFEPLAPSTIMRKELMGLDSRILIETMVMVDAIKSGVEKSTKMRYRYSIGPKKEDERNRLLLFFHEYGTRNMPARPVFLFSREDIKKVFEEYLKAWRLYLHKKLGLK